MRKMAKDYEKDKTNGFNHFKKDLIDQYGLSPSEAKNIAYQLLGKK